MIASGDSLPAQRPRPVMDFTSVLNTLDVSESDGQLEFNSKANLFAAFVPKNSLVDVAFRKIGEPVELHSTLLDMKEHYGKFVSAKPVEFLDETKLVEPGDYLVTYRCNNVPVTRLRVSLTVQDGVYRLNGPWQNWAQLRTPLSRSGQDTPQFVCWLRNETGNPDAPQKYSFQIRKNDELVYEAEDAEVSSTQWQPVIRKFRFPLNIGGNLVTPIEFFNREGEFTIQIRRGKQIYGIFPFQVTDGKLQFHPYQLRNHKPTYEYMITRFAGESDDGRDATNVFWLNSKPIDLAEVANDSGGGKFITRKRRDNWNWLPTADPDRKFSLVQTDVQANDKTHLAVGDDLVVYGTSYPQGVAYLKAGVADEQKIPGGHSFDSRLFWVCGKKIVLIKHKSLTVYDTESDQLYPVRANEIQLYDVSGGLYRSNMVHADGNLIAVVNDLGQLRDQRTIKIVDLGSSQPEIISIRNGKFIPPEISGIAVDVKSETVVVASWQRKTVYHAPIQPNAEFVERSLADFNGIGRKQFHIVNGGLLYADNDSNLRYLKLDGESTPLTLSNGKIGVGGAGFAGNKKRVVMTTEKQSGTRFEMAVADFSQIPRVLEGTGSPIPGTTGEFGLAGHATITDDGTVFLSGTPGGGIGIGEYLQAQHPLWNNWRSIVDTSGKPIQAIDVTCGPRLLAYKNGGYNKKTTIGYATFGTEIDPAELPTTENFNAAKNAQEPLAELSDEDLQLIEKYRKVEKDLQKSFAEAIGQKRGEVQARQAILDVIEKNGDGRLTGEYKRRFKQ